MRFFLVDRIEKIESGNYIEGVKCWTLTDEIFQDHFPGFPVVPGVLLVESMAQLLGTLINRTYLEHFPDKTENIYALLTMIRSASFKKFVRPGDQTRLTGNLTTIDTIRAAGDVEVTVDGEMRAKASLAFILVSESSLDDDSVIAQQEQYFKILTHGNRELGNTKK